MNPFDKFGVHPKVTDPFDKFRGTPSVSRGVKGIEG